MPIIITFRTDDPSAFDSGPAPYRIPEASIKFIIRWRILSRTMFRKFIWLLLITVVLITGCITTVRQDQPVETTGSAVVSSTPPGAEVYLDNAYKGTTPVTILDLPPGSHTLELRLRDYQPWSKSIMIAQGQKISVDTSLAPVPVITSLPTSTQTTVPTTRLTTRPMPKTPAGCWYWEAAGTGSAISYTYELDADGTGSLICKGTDTCDPPQEITWSQTPDIHNPEHSVLVTITSHDPHTGVPLERVLTWDGQADILAYGESDNHVLVFKRTTCSPRGVTIGAS